MQYCIIKNINLSNFIKADFIDQTVIWDSFTNGEIVRFDT